MLREVKIMDGIPYVLFIFETSGTLTVNGNYTGDIWLCGGGGVGGKANTGVLANGSGGGGGGGYSREMSNMSDITNRFTTHMTEMGYGGGGAGGYGSTSNGSHHAFSGGNGAVMIRIAI